MTLQEEVSKWVKSAFGVDAALDKRERALRLLEESMEVCQAAGCDVSDALRMAQYVWSREIGDMEQELGGLQVTTLAMASAYGIDLLEVAYREIDRCVACTDEIVLKDNAKPPHVKSRREKLAGETP